MATVSRYTPTEVSLPLDGELSRDFLDPRQHLQGRPPLEASDYPAYDSHSIFHDVFIDADGSCLRAVGPPMVNLKKALLPVSVSIIDNSNAKTDSDIAVQKNTTPLSHSISERFRLSRHRFNLPKQYHNSDQLHINIRFQNGLEQQLIAIRQKLQPVFLQFTTLQKNNPIAWILEWLRHYRAQGVERVLLYDNGSDDVDDIEHALRELDLDMEVVLIDWPYKYGPKRSYYNYFTQATQNNHSYLCFDQAEWTGHFDLDEYPTIASGITLRDWISSVSKRTALLRFDSYLLPNIRDDASKLPDIRDFHFRCREPHGKAHKYFMRNKAYSLAKTHNGKVKLGYWRHTIPASEACFYHFMGLTTNWRGNDPRQHLAEFDADLYIEEPSLARLYNDTETNLAN